MRDLCLLIILAGIAVTSAAEETGGLTFLVTGRQGRPVAYRVDEFERVQDKRDLKAKFRGLSGEDIPLGTYRYALSMADYQRRVGVLTGTVEVRSRDQWLTLISSGSGGYDPVTDRQVSESFMDPRTLIEGTVDALPHSSDGFAWARLLPLYGEGDYQTAVRPSGTFAFSGVPAGKYVLLILHSRGLLAAEAVTLADWKDHVTLQLKAATPKH